MYQLPIFVLVLQMQQGKVKRVDEWRDTFSKETHMLRYMLYRFVPSYVTHDVDSMDSGWKVDSMVVYIYWLVFDM